MLNVIAIYVVCLYLISLAFTRTKDNLIIGILAIFLVCLFFGFFYYCAVFLALTGMNVLGFCALTIFPVYLGFK